MTVERINTELILRTLDKQLDRQLETAEVIDFKAAVLLFLAMISMFLNPPEVGVDSVVFLAAASVALLALFPKKWECPPKPRAFLHEQKDTSPLLTALQQCSNIVSAYEKNEKYLARKAALLKCGLLLFLLGLVLRLWRG